MTVPLPAALSECACPGRPGRHRLDCQAAIAYDGHPMEMGVRYESFDWEYPVRIRGRVYIEVDVDPVAVIGDRLAEYRQFQQSPDAAGFAEWEQPMAFLCHLIEEQTEVGVWFGGRRKSHDRSYLDELRQVRWTPEDNDRLEAALAALAAPLQSESLFDAPP